MGVISFKLVNEQVSIWGDIPLPYNSLASEEKVIFTPSSHHGMWKKNLTVLLLNAAELFS